LSKPRIDETVIEKLDELESEIHRTKDYIYNFESSNEPKDVSSTNYILTGKSKGCTGCGFTVDPVVEKAFREVAIMLTDAAFKLRDIREDKQGKYYRRDKRLKEHLAEKAKLSDKFNEKQDELGFSHMPKGER